MREAPEHLVAVARNASGPPVSEDDVGAKKFMEMRVQETRPEGPITDAARPLPVTVRVRWSVGTDWVIIDYAWAMSWTREQVLVFWRNEDVSTTAWLHKDQVRRRR